MFFGIFVLNRVSNLSIFVFNWVKCLKQGIKNRNSVLKWVGKSAIFVLNRTRVRVRVRVNELNFSSLMTWS